MEWTEMKKRKKVIFFTSSYSFDGSIINFSNFLRWAVDSKYEGVVLSDTNWHGVIKFLNASTQFKNILSCYIGYRIDDIVFVFEREEEIFKFLKIYNTFDINIKNNTDRHSILEVLKESFKYFKISPCYYIPSEKYAGDYAGDYMELRRADWANNERLEKDLEIFREAHEILCNYLGKPVKMIKKAECSMEIELREPEYTLKTFFSNQKLPRAPNHFMKDLIENEELYKERLEREIKLIKNFNFEDYFYTIKRIVEVAKRNNIMTGPGRGSAVGSLVAYRLGITRIDPVRYDLMFERFLNEGRRDYPDIDIDVEDEKRQTLIELLKKEFGYVYNISTFASLPKKFLESIPESLRTVLKDLPIQRSTHAAGVIISLFPVRAPLSPGTEVLEWDMEDLQQLGYVKFDILGLKTLSILKELRQSLVHKKIKRKNLNGARIYKLIAMGFTDNVFQLDSSLGKTVARDVAPRNVNEIAIAISLNRPGPIRAGITQEIRNLKIKRGKKFNLDILSETYGLPIYQEQIMKIAMELAGFSSSQADALRKAIAKKDNIEMHNLFESLEEALISKIGKEGIEIAKSILAFGEYAFNKSHAIAYAHLTEIMAYFKANYPTTFYDIYLKHDTSVLKDAVYNLQVLGYKVLPPRVKSFNKAVA
ncbi:MAG: DNA polymerase III subunit alpha, partial [Fervidobacterium pennivorans]